MVSEKLKERQALYNGFGDTLARGFELVATPVIFALIGFGLDHLFGITPVLTVILAVFAVIGMSIRTYYVYDARMREIEAQGPWTQRGAS